LGTDAICPTSDFNLQTRGFRTLELVRFDSVNDENLQRAS